MGSVVIVTYESDKIMIITMTYFILLVIYHAYSSGFEQHKYALNAFNNKL